MNGASPKKLLEWIGKQNGISELVPSITSSAPINLVRPTELNIKFLQALHQSTGIKADVLRRMTYHSLNLVVNRHHGCFDKRFRWCPACVYETVRMDNPTHFRLYWSLTGIKGCPIHRTPLQTRCPVCGSFQDGWRTRESLAQCISCEASLAYSYLFSDKQSIRKILPTEILDSPDLILLTKFISEGNGAALITDGPRKALQEAFDYAWERNEEREYFENLPRDECLAYLHCNKPITLTTARRLAYRTGVPLIDLMCGSSKQSTRELDVNWREKLPQSITPHKRKPNKNVIGVEPIIKQVLKSHERPSLRELSRRVGVSTGGLSYYFHDECMLVSKRYKERLEEEKIEKQKESARVVQTAIIEWNKVRINPPSHKGLLKRLFPSSGLPKHILRAEIARALESKSKR